MSGFRIFAFTVGMGEIYVRLNPEALARAVGSGAEMEPVPDDDWVFFPLWQAGQAELPYREFVELAYAHAKTESEGGT